LYSLFSLYQFFPTQGYGWVDFDQKPNYYFSNQTNSTLR